MQATQARPSPENRPSALPPVFVIGSDYVSHRRAANDYKKALVQLGCLTEDLDEAKVVLLHLEAPHLHELLCDIPALKDKYLVHYAVWENTELPDAYADSFKLVDEVWTASSYCAGVFYRAGFEARWLPHIVCRPCDTDVSASALAEIDALLGQSPERFDVLCVTKQGDLRKNCELITAAMPALRRHHPKARLVLKTGSMRTANNLSAETGGTLVIDAPMSDAHVRALILRAMAVVNVSHCEGWGLTLTEAMAEGIPVISTAYGGSMTFLSRQNALLVPSVEACIGQAWELSSPSVRWGHPVLGALEARLVQTFLERGSDAQNKRIAQAKADMKAFAPERIRALFGAYLGTIERKIKNGWRPKARDLKGSDIQAPKYAFRLRHV